MYHGTNTLNDHCHNLLPKQKQDESKGRRKVRKKVYNSPKRKSHTKYSHASKNRWEANLNNLHLKNNKYESDYIGPNRLTKHMGFLAKGKISDSISRLEEIVPKNLKARAKQDLHRILKLSNTKSNTQSADVLHQTNQYYGKSISSDEESNSSSADVASFTSPVKHFVNDSWKQKLGDLSVCLTGKKSVFSSGNKSSKEHTPQQACNEISICREIITKKLHSAITSANNLLFPGVSNQLKIKNELLTIKSQYESSKKVVSNSSNCESSQDTHNNTNKSNDMERMVMDDFQLNPVLTQETSSPKRLESMFPHSQDYSPECDDEIYVDAQILLKRKSFIDGNMLDEFNSKPETSSSGEDGRESPVILIPSSISSNGSPVWVPKASPAKFVPDFPPTPKLYFRQKMF